MKIKIRLHKGFPVISIKNKLNKIIPINTVSKTLSAPFLSSMQADNPLDFSSKPVESLKFLDFTKCLPDSSLKNYRKITANFYEALGFHILESKILNYDANDFMNFIDKFKSDVFHFQTRAQKSLKVMTPKEVQVIFESIGDFMENMNGMLLDSGTIIDRDQALQLMLQTFEENYKNNLLRGLGLYVKATLMNHAESKKPVNAFSFDPNSKYFDSQFFEKERNYLEICSDLKLISELHNINISLISDDGSCKKITATRADKTFYFMYLNKMYLILYPGTWPNNVYINAPIPAPAPDYNNLMIDQYVKTGEAPSSNAINNQPKDEMFMVIENEPVDPSCCCCLCKQKIIEKCFINSGCKHKYCYYCLIERTQQSNCSSICFEYRCVERINIKEMEDYLMEMQMLKEIEDNPNATVTKIPFICSKCQNQEEIRVSEVFGCPEYFICNKCNDFQCCYHNISVEICQCFCLKCKSKLEFFQKIQENICKSCEKRYCSMCRLEKKDCKCYCLVCDNKKRSTAKICDICERQCIKCQIQYEKIFLALADCGQHWICRCCIIKDINFGKCDEVMRFCKFCEEAKEEQVKNS